MNWITRQGFKLASPLAIAELCSQVPNAPRCHCPLVTVWAPAHARTAAIPVPLHHPGVCETGPWEDAALPWHHEWSQSRGMPQPPTHPWGLEAPCWTSWHLGDWHYPRALAKQAQGQDCVSLLHTLQSLHFSGAFFSLLIR